MSILNKQESINDNRITKNMEVKTDSEEYVIYDFGNMNTQDDCGNNCYGSCNDVSCDTSCDCVCNASW